MSYINELNLIRMILVFVFSIFENSLVDILEGKVIFIDVYWFFNNIKYIIVGGNLRLFLKFYIE